MPFVTSHRAHGPRRWTHQKSGRDRMFRCQHCGTVTPPRVSAETVVVETRPRVYPFRCRVQRELYRPEGSQKLVKRDDPGGTGREVVREIRVCPPCKRSLRPDLMVTTT